MSDSKAVRKHNDLDVYVKAFEASCRIFELSRSFPKEETYSLTDQVRRSSRAVAAGVGEAWRHRRYEKSFVSKITVAEGEAAETQIWLQFAVRHGYVDADAARELDKTYDEVLAMLVAMAVCPAKWCRPVSRGK